MKLPNKFPEGCRFGERNEGGFVVEFPDGRWFALSDDGATLEPRPLLDSRGPGTWFDRTEAEFLAAAKAAA